MKRFWFKKSHLAASLVCCTGLSVQAQSAPGVQVYGLLDIGINHVSNEGGSSSTSQGAGMLAPNILGFRGSEDLGGGLRSVFKLETQFSMDTGTTVTGNALFNRGAYLGLDGGFGSVKAGVLDDFMFSHLGLMRYGPGKMLPFVSLNFLRQGPFATLTPTGSFDFDRIANARRVTNSVRYDSPELGGWNFGALAQVGDSTLDGSSDTYSAGALYANGPWTLSLATTRVRYADINAGEDGVTNWGIGGRYDFSGGAATDFLYTHTQNTFTQGNVQVYEVGYTQPLAPQIQAIGQFSHMKGNAVLGNASANQLNFSLHYLLSKRTNLYTSLAMQKVSGTGATAQLPLAAPSSGTAQNVFRVGLFHAF